MSIRGMGLGLGLMFLLSAAVMRADTVTTFSANGLLSDGTVIGGTLTVDVSTGAVTSSDLVASGPIKDTFTSIVYETHQGYGASGYDLVFDAAANGSVELNFSVSPSFTSFQGGGVNGGNIYYPGASSYGPNIDFLTLSVPATVTPEPSTLLLIGTGLAGVPTLRRRLRRSGVTA